LFMVDDVPKGEEEDEEGEEDDCNERESPAGYQAHGVRLRMP